MKRRLALLVCSAPGSESFGHAMNLARAAGRRAMEVSVYCIDDAVAGFADPRMVSLQTDGARLFGCAAGARRRGIELGPEVTWSGLSTVSELMAWSDRFVSFP